MSVLPDWLVFTAALACEGGLFLSIELKHRKIISGRRIYILVKNVCCVSRGSEGIFLRIFHLRTEPASAILGLACLSIFFFFSTVEAAMAVAPMRITQGVWVQATLPQLQNGLPPQSLIELSL